MLHDFASIIVKRLPPEGCTSGPRWKNCGGQELLPATSTVRRLGKIGTHEAAFVDQVHQAVQECRALGISIQELESDLTRGMPMPLTRARDRRLRRDLQGAARSAVGKKRGSAFYEVRLRHKLERWQCGIFPRVRALRAKAASLRLSKLVPPRVCSAVLRTWFNGWCSQKRFQGQGPCILGCGRGEDAIEHYACCRLTAELGANLLALPRLPHRSPEQKLLSFLLLEPRKSLDNGMLTRKALLVAAIYRLHCRLRRGSAALPWPELRTACRQALQELVGGRGRAAAVLDGAFLQRSEQ